MKKLIKKSIGYLFKIAAQAVLKTKNIHIILTYHRIVDTMPIHPYDEGMFISSSTFHLHLSEIQKVFKIVPLNKIANGSDRTKQLCTITFDDGWHDNFVIAYPILKQLQLPATIFLPVEMIGSSNCFWFESLWDLGRKAKNKRKESEFIRYFKENVPLWGSSGLNQSQLSHLTNLLKKMPAHRLDGIVQGAFDFLKIKPSKQRIMVNWEEARIMGQNGISFGSHGLRHYILPTLDQDTKREEIFRSLGLLEQKKVPVEKYFSYPNGNWDVESAELVRQAGYRGALTVDAGYNNRKTDPYFLSRISVHEGISNTPNLFWFRILQAIMAGPVIPQKKPFSHRHRR